MDDLPTFTWYFLFTLHFGIAFTAYYMIAPRDIAIQGCELATEYTFIFRQCNLLIPAITNTAYIFLTNSLNITIIHPY